MCGSLANLYQGSASHNGSWELHYTGIPVVLLDHGETRSRNKRRIQILLAERGTCFTLWHDTIDNLSSYKVQNCLFCDDLIYYQHLKYLLRLLYMVYLSNRFKKYIYTFKYLLVSIKLPNQRIKCQKNC